MIVSELVPVPIFWVGALPGYTAPELRVVDIHRAGHIYVDHGTLRNERRDPRLYGQGAQGATNAIFIGRAGFFHISRFELAYGYLAWSCYCITPA